MPCHMNTPTKKRGGGGGGILNEKLGGAPIKQSPAGYTASQNLKRCIIIISTIYRKLDFYKVFRLGTRLKT